MSQPHLDSIHFKKGFVYVEGNTEARVGVTQNRRGNIRERGCVEKQRGKKERSSVFPQ